MNDNQWRILIGALLAALLLTVLYLLLPFTALSHLGFVFALLSLGLEFPGALWYWAGSSKRTFVSQSAYALVAFWFAVGSIGLTVAVLILERTVQVTMPWQWFLFLQLAGLCGFVILLLAVQSGASHIDQRERTVQANQINWRSMQADVQALVQQTEAGPARQALSKVWEAIRYADPMSDPAMSDWDDAIRADIARLGEAVANRQLEELPANCEALLQVLRDRNARMMLRK